MSTSHNNTDRILTRIVIGVSVLGILYFGYQAYQDTTGSNRENPFAYEIDRFMQSDEGLLHYTENARIAVNAQHVSGIAVDGADNIYVSGDASVILLDSAGTEQSRFGTGETAHCLAVDDAGDIYAVIQDRVEVYDRAGARTARWEPAEGNTLVTSVAVSRDHVYVADAGNRIVWQYDKQGMLLSRIGGKDAGRDIPGFIIPSPYFDVCIDPDGFLWAANTGRHSMENFTPEGDLRSSWGEYSMGIEGFCGCCNPSHFTILEDGKFVTSEKGLPRIKVYNRLGMLESVVAATDQFAFGTVGLDLVVNSGGHILALEPREKAIRVYVRNTE